MTEEPLRLTVIIGSTRDGRFAPVVADWFAGQARMRAYADVDVIDLAEAWLPDVLPADDATELPQPVRDLQPWLARADAFVVVTPEYNHSFPAALKNAIDWFFDEWQAKPVGYVSYGGVSGGLRAVEQLKLVFNELHATSVRTGVCFVGGSDCFDADGGPREPERCERAAKAMLDEIAWWADALRRQRARRPYRAGGAE
ncbi:NAD(P)H-dependent oxidoreductase [Pseudonocardia sp. DSM 110487]|uniref:NADPH-dependent FMN reductase n=1 Tax=Pseudonocardia sp. DSM 110487 TaxID=2865833 RepID=UPI001C6A3DE9|nr:NAD(P)H-dependent oxidoreductase [Pseudonocardia sp. DSM 110487]QYN36663.1 NAD(P)H-dependent oxidoreductase [Pseudonocardia sp. DSM 110487]